MSSMIFLWCYLLETLWDARLMRGRKWTLSIVRWFFLGCQLTIRHVTRSFSLVITWTSILIPYLYLMSMQIIWRSGTLYEICQYQHTNLAVPVMAARATYPIMTLLSGADFTNESVESWHVQMCVAATLLEWEECQTYTCNTYRIWITMENCQWYGPDGIIDFRADSRFAPSQWVTALLCNDVSHCLKVRYGLYWAHAP